MPDTEVGAKYVAPYGDLSCAEEAFDNNEGWDGGRVWGCRAVFVMRDVRATRGRGRGFLRWPAKGPKGRHGADQLDLFPRVTIRVCAEEVDDHNNGRWWEAR